MLDRLHIWLLCAALALFPALAAAQSPIKAFPPGAFQNRAAMDAAPVVGYQGPGDIVSGATALGGCARVYTAALASTSTSLCDLVSSAAPTVVICTLRGSSTGFVDLTGTYCVGTITPATACAAAVGGICNVSKVYDQTGNGNHWTNATAASQPTLQFSALGGLPGLKYASASGTVLSGSTLTIAQPFSISTVYERTSNFTTTSTILGLSSGSTIFGSNSSTNSVVFSNGTSLTATASDSAFHALQGTANGASSAIMVDGSDTTGNAGVNSYTGGSSRFGRGSGGFTPDGIIMEAGIWPSAFSAGNRTSLNTNQHSSTSGYNF